MKTQRFIRSWMLVLVVALVAVAVLVACGSAANASSGSGGGGTTPASTPSSSGGGTGVAIANYAFTPQTLTVKAGTTVTWTNKDSVPHNVISATNMSTSATTTSAFASGNFNQRQTFTFTFSKPGAYYYECSIHAAMPAMHGKIIVQ
jgi:plastocyanin